MVPVLTKRRAKANSLITLSRNSLSRTLQATTGFDFFAYNMFTKSDIGYSANCRLCDDPEETGEHLLLHCPSLLLWRANTLGLLPSSDLESWDWDGFQLHRFLQHPIIIQLENTNKETLRQNSNRANIISSDHSYCSQPHLPISVQGPGVETVLRAHTQ